MKKKTIWSLVLALALVVTAIGTATSAFAATPAPMEPVTKIATENEDAIWEQIEAVEEKSDAIFQRNAALWEKLDEICNALPDDYDFTDFDEAAFIRSTNALTEAEKETLLADIKALNELDAQMEALYAQLPDCDNMPLYEKALEKADPKVLDEIDTLEQEYDRVCEKHADLWDKVDEAYFDLPDDYDFDNYDEAAFIRSLGFLTDAEKDALIADYNRLMLWESPVDYESKKSTIGDNSKTYEDPKELVIDGQQRLTALVAAMFAVKVKDKNFVDREIKISYNPLTCEFAVWSQAYD